MSLILYSTAQIMDVSMTTDSYIAEDALKGSSSHIALVKAVSWANNIKGVKKYIYLSMKLWQRCGHRKREGFGTI